MSCPPLARLAQWSLSQSTLSQISTCPTVGQHLRAMSPELVHHGQVPSFSLTRTSSTTGRRLRFTLHLSSFHRGWAPSCTLHPSPFHHRVGAFMHLPPESPVQPMGRRTFVRPSTCITNCGQACLHAACYQTHLFTKLMRPPCRSAQWAGAYNLRFLHLYASSSTL